MRKKFFMKCKKIFQIVYFLCIIISLENKYAHRLTLFYFKDTITGSFHVEKYQD